MYQQIDLNIHGIYASTLKHYGPLIQYMTAIEEMGELEKAFSKMMRHESSLRFAQKGAGDGPDLDDTTADVGHELEVQMFDEVGDCINMIEQCLFLHDSLDEVMNLTDIGDTAYRTNAHLYADTIISMAKLKTELANAVMMTETGMGVGIDVANMTVYAGEVFRRFQDLQRAFGFPAEALADFRKQKLKRCMKRMREDVKNGKN